MTKRLAQQVKFLQAELEIAIAQDREPKLNAANYPGYWLYLAGEYLPTKDYRRILKKVGLDERDITLYKFDFTRELYILFRQEDKQP